MHEFGRIFGPRKKITVIRSAPSGSRHSFTLSTIASWRLIGRMGPENPRPNDLVHAAYTLQGLVEVEKDRLTFDFGLQRAKQLLGRKTLSRLEQAFEFRPDTK